MYIPTQPRTKIEAENISCKLLLKIEKKIIIFFLSMGDFICPMLRKSEIQISISHKSEYGIDLPVTIHSQINLHTILNRQHIAESRAFYNSLADKFKYNCK